MNFSKSIYRTFTYEEAIQWGKEHYIDWLPKLQNQNYVPSTPKEEFFRYYTQGIHYVYNRILRSIGIDKYNFENSFISKEMFIDSINEIYQNKLCDNITVYRFINNDLLKNMKKWSNIKFIKKDSVLIDKGYMSTTLSLSSVKGRDYATLRNHSLFTIYVPKKTPCVYVDLISDMRENEILFAPNTKLKVINNCFNKFIECIIIDK